MHFEFSRQIVREAREQAKAGGALGVGPMSDIDNKDELVSEGTGGYSRRTETVISVQRREHVLDEFQDGAGDGAGLFSRRPLVCSLRPYSPSCRAR